MSKFMSALGRVAEAGVKGGVRYATGQALVWVGRRVLPPVATAAADGMSVLFRGETREEHRRTQWLLRHSAK